MLVIQIVRASTLIPVTKDYLQGSILNSFFLKPAFEREVISVIDEMKTNKSTGPNSIPTQILKISN